MEASVAVDRKGDREPLAPSVELESDAHLLGLCRVGDLSGFDQMMRKYEKRVYAHCVRMVGNESEGADLTQEVFLKVFRNLARFEERYALYTWIYRITVNTCIDYLRKRKRKYGACSLSIGETEGTQHPGKEREVPDETHSPERLLNQAQLRTTLAEAIESLSDKLRTIIVLKEIEGFSYEEISEVLHCTRGTVKSRLFRARECLRGVLASEKGIKARGALSIDA